MFIFWSNSAKWWEWDQRLSRTCVSWWIGRADDSKLMQRQILCILISLANLTLTTKQLYILKTYEVTNINPVILVRLNANFQNSSTLSCLSCLTVLTKRSFIIVKEFILRSLNSCAAYTFSFKGCHPANHSERSRHLSLQKYDLTA